MRDPVSALGTEKDPVVERAAMLPRGAALLTGAGDLEESGIRHVIHAASGAMTRSGGPFEPTLDSVGNSVWNSLELARRFGHTRVAIPFIGGAIFSSRIGADPAEIAERIVQIALEHGTGLELVFVTMGALSTETFRRALSSLKVAYPDARAEVLEGSLVDYGLHGASAIVNAANMEVQFGGGLSGVIARATGTEAEINAEARSLVRAFYER